MAINKFLESFSSSDDISYKKWRENNTLPPAPYGLTNEDYSVIVKALIRENYSNKLSKEIKVKTSRGDMIIERIGAPFS